MRILSTGALAILSILVLAVYLPQLYEKLFFERVEKTHLFYSANAKRFVYTEKIVGPVPAEASVLAEDHHAETAYRDEDGNYFSRVEFEKRLPFIYYKNMELWGLLPLRLDGQVLDKAAIERNRQVMELTPREIADRRPSEGLWPLLESHSGQSVLVFPEDRFRMTESAMEFVNADSNAPDTTLTTAFTAVLREAGFVFPARHVAGKFTILKPFDEGAFLVDATHAVFHVKRRNGEPVVIRTPIDPALKTRHIKISENRRREYYGLLLAGDGSLHLLTCGGYRLVPLPLDGYDPDRMDFKLIVDPLYRTAVYSDEALIRAVAMDTAYRPLTRHEHRMSRSLETWPKLVFDAVFPFSLSLRHPASDMLRPSLRLGGPISLMGIGASLLVYVAWCLRRTRSPRPAGMALVTLTGVYGLLVALFLMEE